MDYLIRMILERRLLVLILGLVVVAGGIMAWRNLPIDAFPDVTNNQVMILVDGEGLTPEDMEQQITFPIETVMGGLPKVLQVRSISQSGFSQVVVVFEDQVDTYFARQQVQERLQMALKDLPEGVEPELGPISTGLGEVYQYTLESETHSLTELRTIQDWVVAPQLQTIPGITEVNSFGGYVRQLHVVVRPEKLLKYDLTIQDVFEKLEANNSNAPGDFIISNWEQASVRSVGLIKDKEDMGLIVLKHYQGTPVYLGDVAHIREGSQSRQGAVSRDGLGERVAGMAIMLKDENSKVVVDRIKEALPAIERSLPEGVTINPFYDRTHLISSSINTVSGALLQGSFLVILVLFLFLGSLNAAITVAISLPLTAFITFIIMGWQGITANLMSLGGLTIAIGMIVDASIVVTENIVRHLRGAGGRGESKLVITARALKEVIRPISFAILIICMVFLPLLTLEGMEGKMFIPLAQTIVIAMGASLVVSFTIVPVLASWLIGRASPGEAGRKGRGGEGGEQKAGGGRLSLRERVGGRLSRGYQGLLGWALAHSWVTMLSAGVIFAVALLLLPTLGTEFIPDLDEGAIAVNVVRLPTASLDGSVSVSSFLEQRIKHLPEVEAVVSKTGRAEISEDPMGPEQTDLLIMLHPQNEWTTGRTKEELVEEIRRQFALVPGLRLSFSQPIALRVNELVSGIKSDVAVKVFGPDLDTLREYGERVSGIMGGIRGAEDVKMEQMTGLMGVEIIPDRKQLARHGLNVEDVNQVVEMAVGGKLATTFIDGQRRFGVQVRYPEEARKDTDSLGKILLRTDTGARVPLSQVARIEEVEGPGQISREDGTRRVVVETNIIHRDTGSFVAELQTKLRTLEQTFEPGYRIAYGGTFENQQRAMSRLVVVGTIAILVIFLLLYTAFGSLGNAGLIMANLPFALAGGIISMVIFQIPLSVSAAVGFITLFGIAVENGTILLTFINQLQQEGATLREAVIQGCTLRLRALMMTAATTVLGLAPMLYAVGPGAEIQRPLAIVVVGGLITSTMLTLIVLPVFYTTVKGKRQTARA